MKSRDVMTHGAVSIAPDATVLDAIGRMVAHQVSGMPVVDAAGRLVGMVTEGDFVRRFETGTEQPRRRWLELLAGSGPGADAYARAHGHRVRDVMTPEVISVGSDTPLGEVVRLMEEHAIKRLPVVDDGRIVGIVSRADLMLALAQRLDADRHSRTSDEGIRGRIVSEMKRQSWAPSHSVQVSVREGAVRLQGTIFDERTRRALRVLAEGVDGVKDVEDLLTCVEPMSGAILSTPDPAAAGSTR